METHYILKGDEEVCLRGRKEELVFWPRRHQHVERACAATPDEAEYPHKFQRVYGARQGGVVIRSGNEPKESSPSLVLWKNPSTCSTAIGSTCRIKVTFRMLDSGDSITSMGTGFAIGGGMILTAGHLLTLDEEEEDFHVSQIMVCFRTLVDALDYEDPQSGTCFEVHVVSLQREWDDLSLTDGPKGLPTKGSDMVILKGDMTSSFLLPASPAYFTGNAEDKVDVFSTSFPGVDNFIRRAEEELLSDKESSVWDSYRDVMDDEFSKCIEDMAADNLISEDDVKHDNNMMAEVVKRVKHQLLDQLQMTFRRLITGMMACSVGFLVYEQGNDFAIGSRTSLLYGSSGAPVCPTGMSSYFIGCHSGGSAKSDINLATSTDNPIFAQEYIEHVLPALSPPSSASWGDMDLRPFYDWIFRHRTLSCGSDTSCAAMWIKQSEQIFGTSL